MYVEENPLSLTPRVSFETSFDSKQPKLEPKLVSALSETKRLFRLFRFCTETESFDVSIEPKQTENQPKQFKRECTRWKYEVLVYMKYRDDNLILGSDPAVLSSPSYKCIRQQHSTFNSLEAGSLKMNTALEYSTRLLLTI